jgi:hypothetical protein
MFKFEIKVTLIITMAEMSKAEIVKFLMQGTPTGKIATVKKDGSSHVAPIWFVLDKENSKGRIGNVIFTTGSALCRIAFKAQHQSQLYSKKHGE